MSMTNEKSDISFRGTINCKITLPNCITVAYAS